MLEATVQQQYDRLAKIYDLRWGNYISKTLTFLYQWAEISAQATVLDVACGTGEFERLLLQKHPTQKILGIDISEQMLAIARQKFSEHPSVSFQAGSATAIPATDHSFDVVISANAFHYFDQPVAALVEMQRVLKPHGKIVMLDWCKDYLLCRVCDVLLKLTDPAHRQCFTQQELHAFLFDAGLNIDTATKYRFGLIWGVMAVTAVKR